MNYKGLFHQIWMLLSAPGKAWDEIRERGGTHDILAGFVYPLIGLCGLAEFVGAFIGREFSSLMFQVALTRCCAVAVALFGGFFLSAYVLNKLAIHWLKAGDIYRRMQVFVGYSMVVTFVLNIVSGLFSIALLLWILQVYTVFVVFEGVRRWLLLSQVWQIPFTLVATLVILLCLICNIELKMKTNASNINIKNKRASFDYEFIDTYTAGIVLTGTEIKSIRQGKASLVDTFCFFSRGELWVKNMHIAEYFYGSYNNHAARRDRKLLLTKKELRKLERTSARKGWQRWLLPWQKERSNTTSVRA